MREKLIYFLLAPISLLYGFGVLLRDGFYKLRLLKSVSFSVPVIGVGNLSIGGAGKTPHVEYLIEMLRPYLEVAVLSRGYKRKTHGFREVTMRDDATTVGDEPLQYRYKYRDIVVAVGENRVTAIPRLLQQIPDIQTIILDDSFQHRGVTPSLHILLTEYRRPYFNDVVLPSGRLREWPSASVRADIIIVSKCPYNITQDDRDAFLQKLAPLAHQRVFFSAFRYGAPYSFWGGQQYASLSDSDVILLTGVARATYIREYLEQHANAVYSMEYEDHHYFSPHEMSQLFLKYDNLDSSNKIIITTEKDATRLMLHRDYLREKQLPIYILPIKVEIRFDEAIQFERTIKNHLLEFVS